MSFSDLVALREDKDDPNLEYYYRYEGHASANGGYDIMGEWQFSNSYTYSLYCHSYRVLKHTPKGAWIATKGYTNKPNNTNATFVNNSHRKRFAAPTKEEALQSFIARKEKEASIHYHRGQEAERYKRLALQIAEESHIPITLTMSTYLFGDNLLEVQLGPRKK